MLNLFQHLKDHETLKRVQGDRTSFYDLYSKSAFTLAEVLITLVIIGVIAAITVPTLINKTQNQEYVSKLKKAYSTMAQVTNLIIAEEGMPRGDKGGWASSAENVYNMYKKYLRNAKECGIETGCIKQTYKNMNGHIFGDWNDNANLHKFVLADGTLVIFSSGAVHLSLDCSQRDNGSENRCASMWVDVNGSKKPNVWGRDTFEFVLKENGLYPAGCDYEFCNQAGDGWGCACKVLREGAMNY